MYITDNMMEKLSSNLPFQRKEEIVQPKLINHVEKEPEPEENIIGQYKNTYILIEQEDGLEIVDQHIAEERYIYEKLKSEKNIVSQLLFVSDVLTVSNDDAELIKENIQKKKTNLFSEKFRN